MKPLAGLTVVSIEQAVAAPFATRQLADLGARVIKIERPNVGDFCRHYDETVHGMSSHFVWLNRSKESIALNLKSQEDLATARKLVERADVFVQNLAPGAVERMGLGADELHATNAGLIHCSISGYGPNGPYSHKKAYDLMIQCESGLMSVTGTPEVPSKVGVSIADIAAGMYAFTGIQTAVIQRQTSGKGATLQLSMLEALTEWMGYPLYYTEYGGTAPGRTGAQHATIAPYGPFPVKDGKQIFLGVHSDREWSLFCHKVLRRPEMASDARFASGTLRLENRSVMAEIIRQVLADVPVEIAADRLDEAGIANAILRDVPSVVRHPQLQMRDRWRNVESPIGPIRALIPPATLEGCEPVMEPIPEVGQHTAAILAELEKA